MYYYYCTFKQRKRTERKRGKTDLGKSKEQLKNTKKYGDHKSNERKSREFCVC